MCCVTRTTDRFRSAGSQEDSDGKNGKVCASLFRSGHVQSKFISITGNGMLQQALQSMRLMPPSQAHGDIQADAVQPSEGADGLEADDQEESRAREALRKLLPDYSCTTKRRREVAPPQEMSMHT